MNKKFKQFYHTLKIKTGSKIRNITIYDKEAKETQRSLYNKYESIMNESIDSAVYSYRKGHSNWSAMEVISSKIQDYKYFYRCDIKDFFSSIDRKYLRKIILKIVDKEAANQIMEFVTCCKSGISEGSPLSPILSNLVLSEFDKKIQEKLPNTFYIRYGDDILLLSNNRISYIAVCVQEMLRIRGFELNRQKVEKGIISEGFNYLGFHINSNGAKIQKEKLERIIIKIESEQNKIKRKEIIKGWRSYYRDIAYLPDHPATVKILLYENNSKDLLKLHLDKTRQLGEEDKQQIINYAIRKLSLPMLFKLILNSRRNTI